MVARTHDLAGAVQDDTADGRVWASGPYALGRKADGQPHSGELNVSAHQVGGGRYDQSGVCPTTIRWSTTRATSFAVLWEPAAEAINIARWAM